MMLRHSWKRDMIAYGEARPNTIVCASCGNRKPASEFPVIDGGLRISTDCRQCYRPKPAGKGRWM